MMWKIALTSLVAFSVLVIVVNANVVEVLDSQGRVHYVEHGYSARSGHSGQFSTHRSRSIDRRLRVRGRATSSYRPNLPTLSGGRDRPLGDSCRTDLRLKMDRPPLARRAEVSKFAPRPSSPRLWPRPPKFIHINSLLTNRVARLCRTVPATLKWSGRTAWLTDAPAATSKLPFHVFAMKIAYIIHLSKIWT
jgi:hypothetical protein